MERGLSGLPVLPGMASGEVFTDHFLFDPSAFLNGNRHAENQVQASGIRNLYVDPWFNGRRFKAVPFEFGRMLRFRSIV